MKEVEYVCTKCGAVDHERNREKAPEALNCYKCGAGRGKSLTDMLSGGEGMFPRDQIHPTVLEELGKGR